MKKKILMFTIGSLLLGSIILSGCSNNSNNKKATAESSTSISSEVKTTKVNWPYYKIEKDGEVKGHLLGTVHIGKPEMYPFPEQMIDDLNKSTNLISELGDDRGALAPENTAESMATEVPITEDMTEETREKYQSILATYDLTEDDVKEMNRYGVNMFLFVMTSADTDENVMAERSQYGVESQLDIFHKQNKEQKHIGLETQESQQNMLIEIQEKPEDINEWVKTLKTKKENAESSNNIAAIDIYIENGENELSDIHPEQNEIGNFTRNKTWSEKLPDYLTKENESFIAVGNAHLGSEKGLVELLRKQGFEVTKISFN